MRQNMGQLNILLSKIKTHHGVYHNWFGHWDVQHVEHMPAFSVFLHELSIGS